MNNNVSNKRDKCVILSLDGGGVRGIISSLILAEINAKLDYQLFDKVTLLIGCSTGAISAGLLTCGHEVNLLPALYKNLIPKVFNKGSWTDQLLRKTKLFPAYDKRRLLETAEKYIGRDAFSSFTKKTLIPIYDITNDKLQVAKNWKGQFKDCLLSDLVVASSCFPSLYSPHEIFDIHGVSHGVFVDGGIASNNPTLYAIVEALDLGYELDDIICISVGTGCDVMTVDVNKSKNWGGFRWLSKLPLLLGSGNSESIDYISRHLIPKLYRFQVSLDNNLWGLNLSNVFATDDEDTVKDLIRLSKLYIDRDKVFRNLLEDLAVVIKI